MSTYKKGPTHRADPIRFPLARPSAPGRDCNKRLPRSMQKQSNRDSRQLKLPAVVVLRLLASLTRILRSFREDVEGRA